MTYRCYVVQGGRIIAAEDIDAAALDEAKMAGFRMVEERSDSCQIDGIEIWQGSSFLYKSEPTGITEAQYVDNLCEDAIIAGKKVSNLGTAQ
jgi:hypothetical protein